MIFWKKVLLFWLFFAFFGFNLYLIVYIYTKNLMIKEQRKILADIAGVRNSSPSSSTPPSQPAILGAMTDEIKLADGRGYNLRAFFAKYQSPLYDFTDEIVAASDKYGIDYRLLPAIAMQESNLCRYAAADSHNCWGWGIYGNRVTKFASFEEAIATIAKNLREDYLDKGYTTPELIMSKYTPRSPGSWARSINWFITSLE